MKFGKIHGTMEEFWFLLPVVGLSRCNAGNDDEDDNDSDTSNDDSGMAASMLILSRVGICVTK
jgi:hypothetical protein